MGIEEQIGSRLQNESDGYLIEQLDGCTRSIESAKKDIEKWEKFKNGKKLNIIFAFHRILF